jgi:DNA processing protein
MKTQKLLHALQLSRSENVGPSTFFRLIEIFGTASEALKNLPEFAKQGGLRHQIKIFSSENAEAEINSAEKFNAKIISFFDFEYPALLRKISDPSPILTIKGNYDLFNRDSVAIVGPRNASFSAINFSRKVATVLGKNSIVTVSGLARGIDTAAHQGSLLTGTIAVIAGGINHIYPKENADLYEIISKQGLLVSENSFNASPKGGNFIQRNRIISGLSLGVIVVEAGLKSGSLTTAKFAIDHGRQVFAVPGSPLDPRCHGTNRLIKDGAKMFEGINDILDEFPNLKFNLKQDRLLREPDSEPFEYQIKIPSDAEIIEIRQEIFSRLSLVPVSTEEIMSELQISARLVNIALAQLELADKIEVSFGKVVLKS